MDNATPLARFLQLLDSGEKMTSEDVPMVFAIIERYPYFTLPAAMALEAEDLDSDTKKRLKSLIAVNAPNRDTLMKLTDPDGRRFASFYPPEPEPETPSTDKAIDTFLDQYGTIDPKEQSLLERLIFNPVPDYSQVLASQAREMPDTPKSEQDALLDAFLAKQEDTAAKAEQAERELIAETANHPVNPATVKTDAEAPLSESLAKIYIKRGQYDKAYEIIHQLSLNFPKKSIYFADQLRFLRKAMLITGATRKK